MDSTHGGLVRHLIWVHAVGYHTRLTITRRLTFCGIKEEQERGQIDAGPSVTRALSTTICRYTEGSGCE